MLDQDGFIRCTDVSWLLNPRWRLECTQSKEVIVGEDVACCVLDYLPNMTTSKIRKIGLKKLLKLKDSKWSSFQIFTEWILLKWFAVSWKHHYGNLSLKLQGFESSTSRNHTTNFFQESIQSLYQGHVEKVGRASYINYKKVQRAQDDSTSITASKKWSAFKWPQEFKWAEKL